ncbi:MAG: hypothetical protein HKN46_00685 [Acidimicrobiia bacterium]|nr:hypothetical protein [Acidimicrobiia bacterium]
MSSWEDPRIRAGLPRQLARRRAELARGSAPIGWKVGFGAPSALEMMEIEAPLIGYLTDRTVMGDGVTIETAGWTKGLVEFEVAVWMGDRLGAGATPADARRAVAAIGPAIEVADLDLTPAPDAVEEILAGDIFHRGVVFGARDPARAGIDLDGLVARIQMDGAPFAETDHLEAITGRYDEVVATVANTLGAFGEELEEGTVIITGSVIPPVPLDDGIEFTFSLGEYPPLSVRRA